MASYDLIFKLKLFLNHLAANNPNLSRILP